MSLPVKYSLFPSLQNAQLSSQRKPAAIGTKTGRKETASCLFPDPGIPDQHRTLHHEANLQENRSHNQVLHKERSKATQKSSVPPLTHLSHCVKEKHKSKYTQGPLQQQQLCVCVCAMRRERTGHFLSSPTGCSTEGAILQKFSQNYGISEFEPESPWAAAVPPLQASSAQCEKSAQGLDPEESSPLPVRIMIPCKVAAKPPA